MSEELINKQTPIQIDLDKINTLVYKEFEVEEFVLKFGSPTYYLKKSQETKNSFLRLIKNLKEINLIALLREENERLLLKIFQTPMFKKSNNLVNWLLFIATIATTFITGYFQSPPGINPFIGGATFSLAILAILGFHEMGHKITADNKEMNATLPYFIPGLPPLGTFGALIMQKDLPPNRDALFDIGANGPISGFIIATIVSFIGLMLLVPATPNAVSDMGLPILWILLLPLLSGLNLIPSSQTGYYLLHPVAWAGWVGLFVTMLNLLPAAMLDGGHITRSLTRGKTKGILTVVSIIFLLLQDYWFMAILVILMSGYKHPGPLDDVSSLSKKRKILTIGLIIIFILCILLPQSYRI
jgi:Zn-dependent protease